MTAILVMFFVVVYFWSGLWFLKGIANILQGRRWDEGCSIIPLPFLSIPPLIVGWLVNWAWSPWGTWIVAVLHAGFALWLAAGLIRYFFERSE